MNWAMADSSTKGKLLLRPFNLLPAGLFGLVLLLALTACQSGTVQVFIEVDGGRQILSTTATTVRQALVEANVTLEPLDRVNPDLYIGLEPGLVIVVTRVREEIEIEREVVPFERQVVTNEALATGETRMAQLGVNGEDEVSIRVVYENGVEVNRTEVARTTVIAPVPEILVVGPKGQLPSTPVEGTIAYLSAGNAWVMRDSSGSRRALTNAGNLDGRVFSLSPDGRQLVYTQQFTDTIDLPLNELMIANTTIVGEKPISLGISGVLNVSWSPTISRPLLTYSTAERTPNAPGWRANNDLWLLDPAEPASPVQLVTANTQGLYPWWGTSFAWSPDGSRLAYARPDQVGLIPVTTTALTGSVTPLVDFPPLKTFSEWVWVPGISWSPDGKFLALTVHGPPLASEPPEESPLFDLWLIDATGVISAPVARQVGMWSNPAWGEAGLAFGQALNPLQSANSRYSIQLVDRDGSNRRQLFPFREELGVKFPELVWLPRGRTLLFTYEGNLYTADTNGSPPRQLTSDGQTSRLSWAAPVFTTTALMTSTTDITGTVTPAITGTVTISATPAMAPSPAITGTVTVTVTPAAPFTPTTIPTQIPEPAAPISATLPLSNTLRSDEAENRGSITP